MLRTTLAVLVLLCLAFSFSAGCSSRPKATEADTLYYTHGGETLRRKRTETRNVTQRVWNKDTKQYDNVTRQRTITVLEIESSDGRIVDYEASLDLANQLREGQPIPTITLERAAAAGLVGNCVKVTNVVIGGNAAAAGMQRGDLILRYNGRAALGTRALRDLVDASNAEETVTIVVERGKDQLQLTAQGGPLGIETADEWR